VSNRVQVAVPISSLALADEALGLMQDEVVASQEAR
jgi:hypothetical protein